MWVSVMELSLPLNYYSLFSLNLFLSPLSGELSSTLRCCFLTKALEISLSLFKMAAESIPRGDEKLQTEVPLLDSGERDGAQLSKSIRCLESFLRFFGYCQYSFLSFLISWLSFLILGVVLPVFMIKCSASAYVEKYQINSFEFQILVFQSLASVISLVCISHNLRKYGVRNFLFVDRSHGQSSEFRDEYVKKIHVSNSSYICISIPSSAVCP